MSTYRIQYADPAEAARKAMPPEARTGFERAMGKTLSVDPYGHGSIAVKGGDRDYREVTVAGTFVVYDVSASILVVTAVRIVH
ncbi:type II toxin-antitoxin system RelE/ParE family toxin [Streptomyces sp. NPDC059122]|uniref:type II toxin-antitoxin system RelE family toxin n=1 Tax=Streptomyces sp. NPDC059122 TaxID=3346732 RepID=UPI0036800010